MNGPAQHEQRIQTVCLLILTTVSVAFALYWLRPVMIPFVLAIFFTLALAPIINLLIYRVQVPRVVAVGVTFLLGIVLLVVLWTLISASVRQMAENAGAYQVQLDRLVQWLDDALPLESLGIGVDTESGVDLKRRLPSFDSSPPARQPHKTERGQQLAILPPPYTYRIVRKLFESKFCAFRARRWRTHKTLPVVWSVFNDGWILRPSDSSRKV